MGKFLWASWHPPELKASHKAQMDALQARVSALELLVMVAKPEQNQA